MENEFFITAFAVPFSICGVRLTDLFEGGTEKDTKILKEITVTENSTTDISRFKQQKGIIHGKLTKVEDSIICIDVQSNESANEFELPKRKPNKRNVILSTPASTQYPSRSTVVKTKEPNGLSDMSPTKTSFQSSNNNSLIQTVKQVELYRDTRSVYVKKSVLYDFAPMTAYLLILFACSLIFSLFEMQSLIIRSRSQSSGQNSVTFV